MVHLHPSKWHIPPGNLPRSGVSVPQAPSSVGGIPPSFSMRGEHKPKYPERNYGWEVALATCNHEVGYHWTFREKAQLNYLFSSLRKRKKVFILLFYTQKFVPLIIA